MKVLLGLASLFMLPLFAGFSNGNSKEVLGQNIAESSIAYSPEAYHDSSYYSIDLVVDGSLSYRSDDVRLICRTTGYSSGVQFSVGGYYQLTNSQILNDGNSFEIHLRALYSFETVGTTITARQYDSQTGNYITCSEMFYSANLDGYISLSTTSMEHASDCADLASYSRSGLDAEEHKIFETYWNEKNNSRTSQYVRSNPVSWRSKNSYMFYLRNGSGYEPLRRVNVGIFTSLGTGSPQFVYLTDDNGQIIVPYNCDVKYLRVMSCSIDHYYSDAGDPDDPKTPTPFPKNYAIDGGSPLNPNGDSPLFPHGVALYRAKDKTGTLSMYFHDFFVEADSAMDFYIDVNSSSSFGQAMKITQTLAYGKKYVEEVTGAAMDAYEVYQAFYPCSGSRSFHANKGSHSNGVSNVPNECIYISEEDYSNPDVVLHEYGHCVQRKYRFGDSLGVPHYLGVNNSILLDDQHDGVRLAWGEAWPTVFANLVTQYFGAYFFGNYGTVDATFDSHDCSFSLECPTVRFGQESEEDIAGVLYDLFDTDDTIEAFDRLHYGHEGLWKLMAEASQYNNGLKTFSDFVSYYQATQSSDNNERLQNIMKEYGFSPNPTTNGRGTITSGPTISWNSVSYAFSYDVVLYNGFGTKVVTRTSNTNTYTINNSDWMKLLVSPTDGWYYEIIANVLINGNSYHYSSGRISMTKPSGIEDGGLLEINNTNKRAVLEEIWGLKTNVTKKYTFRVASYGYTTFQTVGPYGSHIELYDSNNNLVATGVGGMYGKGYGSNSRQKNGFIRYYCNANTNYTLLVRDCNSGRNYHGTLIIMQAYACTKGSSSYDSADSLEELVSNDGVFIVSCYQKKVSIFNYIPTSGIGTFTARLSSAFDTYLYVVDTLNGSIYEDDNSAGNGDAMVDFQASSGNRYLIMVTQRNPMNNPYRNRKVDVHIWKN